LRYLEELKLSVKEYIHLLLETIENDSKESEEEINKVINVFDFSKVKKKEMKKLYFQNPKLKKSNHFLDSFLQSKFLFL
jgi:hypothetical protein